MPLPPSYAPTGTTSYTQSSNLQYHDEITRSSLIKTPLHKNVYDSLAEICSIVPTLELLENSYLKDYITDKEKFTSTSYRLIHQYQLIAKGFENDAASLDIVRTLLGAPGLEMGDFLARLCGQFNLLCPLAIKRLQLGFPATIEHLSTQVDLSSHPVPVTNATSGAATGSGGGASGASARLIAEITGNFITCMDALKLNYKTKDQLHPLLSDLVVNLNDLVDNGSHKMFEFQGKSKLVNWLIKLNNLDGDLDQDSVDVFLDDLDLAYKGFYASLE